jgi:DNA polymerase III delta subunit
MPPGSRSAKATPAAPAPSGPERVILLTGPEAGRKTKEAADLVRAHVAADWADFDSETLDGHTTTADRALANVATAPLGEGRRIVLLRDTQQMDAEEQKRLAAGLARIPASGLLILHTGAPVVEDGKTKRGSVVAIELTNAVKKTGGRILDFGLPRVEDLRGWLAAEAKRLHKTLAPDALALLAQLPGEDQLRAATELAKAAAHAGDAPTITVADVEATLSRGPDDVIFKLCDAVGARRTAEALGHVATLFQSGARPESVAPRALVLLARQIRLLAQFKYLAGKNLVGRNAPPLPPEIAKLLPADGAAATLANPRTAWMADKYAVQARHFSGTELLERLEKLLQADLALKGVLPGGDSPRLVLQRLVLELC